MLEALLNADDSFARSSCGAQAIEQNFIDMSTLITVLTSSKIPQLSNSQIKPHPNKVVKIEKETILAAAVDQPQTATMNSLISAFLNQNFVQSNYLSESSIKLFAGQQLNPSELNLQTKTVLSSSLRTAYLKKSSKGILNARHFCLMTSINK